VARIKQGGGIAGHNGLKDISQRIASHDYWRLRLGIGHPGDKGAVADYVLHKPSTDDKAAIDQAIERALQVVPEMLKGDMQAAIQKLHSGEPRPEKKEPPKKEAPVKEAPVKEAQTPPEPPKPQAKKSGLLGSLFGKK
jgi:PTH1 family peptidyl-tRNA hydrolase